MAKPKNIILTEEGVITQEALLAYAQGRLSPEEIAQVDKLLRDDPFAQEALDGVRNSAAAAGMDTAVTAINSRLREKAGMREKKRKGVEIHWATYAYAAMIAGVLLGLGFVMVHFMQQNDTPIAMNKAVPQAEESIPVTEQKISPAPPVTDTVRQADAVQPPATDTIRMMTQNQGAIPVSGNVSSSTQGHTQSPATQSALKIPVTSSGATSAFTPAADRKAAVQPDAVVSAKAAAPPAAEVAASKMENRADNAMTDKNAAKPVIISQTKAEAKKEKANATAADNMKEARALFDAGDFKEAAKKYDKVLSDQPENMDALFFGGICEYKNGKLKPAEKNFDKLIKSGQYVDGSKWYKANVLIDRGKKDEAKQLLKELSTTSNPYKDRAIKKYDEVQK